MPKQTTLLQTWGYSGNENLFQDGDEDLDSFLVEALDQSSLEPSHSRRKDFEGVKSGVFVGNTEGFDHNAGHTWVYPINYPVREYQLSISESCLYENTLVSLPTGLGKTFIAAVVMYNYYRWYPQGVIVFLAPTKPLVAQQITACFNIMGIPSKDVAKMTGNNPVHSRKKDWASKRVFFMTPQVLANDLSRGLLPTTRIKCVVIDEAHRACGDYAYCQVVKELKMSGTDFRVVALSATPGNDVKSVQNVLLNLGISKIELRSEDSPDIVPYTFQRDVEKIVVPLSSEMEGIKEKYTSLVDSYLRRLKNMNVIGNGKKEVKTGSISKFSILQSRNEFRQNPPERFVADRSLRGSAECNFASCISLLHAYELLIQHGLRPFYNFLQKTTDAVSGNKRLRSELSSNELWTDVMGTLQKKFECDASNSLFNSSRPNMSTQFAQNIDSSDMSFGHPKLNKLLEIVNGHFESKGETPSRVMIFSQYRDSVQEIVACLHGHRPKIRAMEFIGQNGTKAKRGLTQKEQIEIIRRFKVGGYNTLVSTCVGEEGLDIGEVDLIICFDVSKSPIQLVQRMGRTGRKRSGRIVVLVTKGKEEMTYNQCLYSKKSIDRAILEKNKLTQYLLKSPRMVPLELNPKCHKIEMIINTLDDPSVKKPKGKAGKTVPSKRTQGTKKKDVDNESISVTEDPFATSKSSTFKNPNSKETALKKATDSYAMYSTILDSPVMNVEEDIEASDAYQPPVSLEKEIVSLYKDDNVQLISKSPLISKNIESDSDPSDSPDEFDDIYPEVSRLDIKRFRSNLFDSDNEDLSELETMQFDIDDVLEIYNEIKREYSGALHWDKPVPILKKSQTSVHTSTPCRKTNKQRESTLSKETLTLHNTTSPRLNSVSVVQKMDEVSNYDMEFDHADFFEEIGSDTSMSRTPNSNKMQKSLYSATQLTSFMNKSTVNSAKKMSAPVTFNAQASNPPLLKAQKSELNEANFDVELNSDDDMFADSICEEVAPTHTSNVQVMSNDARSPFTPIFESNKTCDLQRDTSSLLISPSTLGSSKLKKPRMSLFPSSASSSSKKPDTSPFDPSSDEDDSIMLLYESKATTTSSFRNKSVSSEKEASFLTQRSPLVAVKRPKKFDFESDSDEDSSFVKPQHNRTRSQTKAMPRKTSSSKGAAAGLFIHNEADVDDSEGSSDEFVDESREKDLDYYDPSFVDDATQADAFDHRAMYLQSSKEVRGGKFKMPSKPLAPITDDIYSQLPNEESDDEYENDSFCVDDESLEFSDSKAEVDETMALIAENTAPKKSRIRRPINDSDDSSEDEQVVKKVSEKSIVNLCEDEKSILKLFEDEKPIVKLSDDEKSMLRVFEDEKSMEVMSENDSFVAKTSSKVTGEEDKECILVNTSEFHSCHELISNLKYTFQMQISVRSFEGAGFILSPRLAVDRIMYSVFLNGGQRSKIVARCQLMNDLYERPFIILEQDGESNAFSKRTKYADMIFSQISQSNIRLLFSKNQKTSAEIISNLLSKESQKKFSFKYLLENKSSIFNDEDFKVVSFYKSVPGIGVGLGYLLSSNYSSLASFAKTAVATLMRKGNVDEEKARKIQNFLRKQFVPELTELGK